MVEGGKEDKRPAVVMDDVRGVQWVSGAGAGVGSVLPKTGPNGCALMVRNVSSSNFSGVGSASCLWAPKEAE